MDIKDFEEHNDDDVPIKQFHCTIQEWHDWQWQIKNRIKDINSLKKYFPALAIPVLDEVIKKYPFAITPYYASKIRKLDYSDPIFAMAVPQIQELYDPPCLSDDPLHENKETVVPFLVHRYKDRCLLICTTTCGTYCRHCTRKRLAGKKESHISTKRLEKIKDYLLQHKEVKDVIISGGDPLTQENYVLEEVLSTLRSIPSIEIIRIGTRIPVVLPQRITPKLISLLKRYKPLWINTHFNHPQEITPESISACRKIVNAGIPMGNQTVLLKGVNDDFVVMEELCRKLISIPVKPYYIYQCDLVRGVEHFRTPFEKGIEIMRHLIGKVSGIAIPTFVVDAPEGKGKIPILPQYYVGKNEHIHHFLNYENLPAEYPDPV